MLLVTQSMVDAMAMMKVAMYYNNTDVRIEQMVVPVISDDELLVKVQASGICGSDVMEWYRIKKAPRVLGHEISGDVVEVGKHVEHVSVGDRVFVSHHVPCNTCCFCLHGKHTLCDMLHSTNFYPGGFAEYLRVPAINVDRGVFKLPPTMSYEEGVFIEPLACVLRGMRSMSIQPGASVLVIGSGISGILQIKLARLYSAGRILAVDIDEQRLQWAKDFGADVIVNAKDVSVDCIKKLNDGCLVDNVIISAGAVDAIQQGIRLVDAGGRILFFAPPQPGLEIPFPLFDLWNKQVVMSSTYAGSPCDIDEAITLISLKKILVTDMITHRLPLTKAADGFRLVASAHDSLKVILFPSMKG